MSIHSRFLIPAVAALAGVLLLTTQMTSNTQHSQPHIPLPESHTAAQQDSNPTHSDHTPTTSTLAQRLGVLPEAYSNKPSSLFDTEVDGGFLIDEHGQFVANRSALQVFLYFFSASGEEPDAVIRSRILLHAINQGVSEQALIDIAATLDRYMAFRLAAKELITSGEWVFDDLQHRFELITQLREEVLGYELSQAFFSKQDQLQLNALERRNIEADISLTEEEKHSQLSQLAQQSPSAQTQAYQSNLKRTKVREQVAQLKTQGASKEEIFNIRSQAYGDAAATRLQILDDQRRDWQRRLTAFSEARTQLQQNSLIGSDQYQNEMNGLYQQFFKPEELPKVKAYERFVLNQ